MDIKYFEMWEQCRKDIIDTMIRNMMSDLDAGYDPLGKSIRKQLADIQLYRDELNQHYEKFSMMTERQINHYCFFDMKRRGDID